MLLWKNMDNKIKVMAVAVITALAYPVVGTAQPKVSLNGKVDFVTDYVWRGAYQGSDFSVQPSLTLGYAGFSLNAWGNQSLSKEAKEFDINLSYTYRNLTLTVSDYWWSGVDHAYGDYKNDHYFEGTLAYNFGEAFPLSLSWSTMFAGADKDEKGDLRASTYIAVSYPISLPADIMLTPAVGFTPWKGMYHDKAGFTDISLKASKELKITEHFALPVFVQAIASPIYDRTYLVGGVSIGF